MKTAYSEETRRIAEKGVEDKKRLEPDICDYCAFIEKNGWHGMNNGSHCRQCHAIWHGSMAAHTLCCHRTFSSNSATEDHNCDDPSLSGLIEVTHSDGVKYWSTGSGGARSSNTLHQATTPTDSRTGVNER